MNILKPIKKQRQFASCYSSRKEKLARASFPAFSPSWVSLNSARAFSPVVASDPGYGLPGFVGAVVVQSQRTDSEIVKVPITRIPPKTSCTGTCHSREILAMGGYLPRPGALVNILTLNRSVLTYIIDPVSGKDTPRIHPLIEGTTSTSDLLGSRLSRFSAEYIGTTTLKPLTPNPANNSGHIPSSKRARIDSFEECANQEHSCGPNDVVFPTVLAGEMVDDEARQERTELFRPTV